MSNPNRNPQINYAFERWRVEFLESVAYIDARYGLPIYRENGEIPEFAGYWPKGVNIFMLKKGKKRTHDLMTR